MRLRPLLARSLPALLLTPAAAFPFPRDNLHDLLGLGWLMPRQCAQYCGALNQYCCNPGEACFTTGTVAGCSNTAAGGGFALFTTTWTETQTYTRTSSSYFPAATTPAPHDCIPAQGSGQIACGSICCANWQYCAFQGQCMANAGVGGGNNGGGNNNPPPPPMTTGMTTYTSGGVVVTTQFSAPYKVIPTGTDTTVPGATGTGTALPGTGGTAGGGLSPGAIAGIVIGVLAGVVILVIVCACCLVRGLWHTLMGLLGLRKKDDHRHERETVIEEERYERHGHGRSHHGSRERHTGWFGMGGGRPSSVAASRKEKKKSSSGLGWLGLAGAAGTLLLLLGLRKDKNKKSRKGARSEVSSSYFGSDSYTASSPSSRSAARTHRTSGTHRSHRSRRTEGTRLSPRGPPSRAPSRRP